MAEWPAPAQAGQCLLLLYTFQALFLLHVQIVPYFLCPLLLLILGGFCDLTEIFFS